MAKNKTAPAGGRTQKTGKSDCGLRNKKVAELRAMVRKERNAGKHPNLTGKDVSLLKKDACLALLGKRKARKPTKANRLSVASPEPRSVVTVPKVEVNAPVPYRQRTLLDVITAWVDGIDRLKNPWMGSGKLVQVSGRWMEIQYHRGSKETRMVAIGGQGWFGVEPVREPKAPNIQVMELPQGEPESSMLEIETGGFGAMINGR